MLELICIKKYLLIKTNTIMLKYIKKAYIMSLASYNETPGGAEVQNTQEEKDFQEQVNLAIADWKIDESEILNLKELYEAEKNNIKESFVDARRNQLILVIAQNLVLNNTDWEFENEFEVGADAIQIDWKYLGIIDKDTFFNSEYAEIANRFGITSTEVLNEISKMAPGRVELDTIGNIEDWISKSMWALKDKVIDSSTEIYKEAQELMIDWSVAVMNEVKDIKEWYESYQDYINKDVPEYWANITDEATDYLAEVRDKAIVAAAENLDPSAAKKRLAKKSSKEKETTIAQATDEKDNIEEKAPKEKDNIEEKETVDSNWLTNKVNSIINTDNNLYINDWKVYYKKDWHNYFFTIKNHPSKNDKKWFTKWLKSK